MDRIQKAIEVLETGIEIGDEPEGRFMQRAIDILSESGTESQNVSFEIIKGIQDENAKLKKEIDNQKLIIGALQKCNDMWAEKERKGE